jgi:histidyl-tRNA synthetase
METNPLRVLDSKVDGPKLPDAPKITEYLCAACRSHYDLFLSLVKSSGLHVEQNPRLVRGLDYYSRTVFEFISSDLGAQSAVAAGGRYDELVEHLGGPAVPAVGFALGMDRVVAARAAQEKDLGPKKIDKKMAYVIPLSDEANVYSFEVLQKLRRIGLSVPPVLLGKKLKNQMSHAVDSGANWAILIGEDELKASEVTVKNLETRAQEKVKLNMLETWFKNSWQ